MVKQQTVFRSFKHRKPGQEEECLIGSNRKQSPWKWRFIYKHIKQERPSGPGVEEGCLFFHKHHLIISYQTTGRARVEQSCPVGPLWLTHSGYGGDAAPAGRDAEGWHPVSSSWYGYRTLVETFAGWIPGIVEDSCLLCS